MRVKPIDPYDRARRYRQVFLDAVGEADITAIADKLVEQAKAGDPVVSVKWWKSADVDIRRSSTPYAARSPADAAHMASQPSIRRSLM